MTEYKARKIARILNDVLASFRVRAGRHNGAWAIFYGEAHRRNTVLFETEQHALHFMNGIEVPAVCAAVGCGQKALWRTRLVGDGGTAFYYVCRDHEYLHKTLAGV